MQSNRPRTPVADFTFVDLFAGIGGMRKAFEAVGGRCVASCEWNRFARQTYAANFDIRDHPFFEDIRKVDESEVPGHDILLAGFPCQPFSLAGVSKKNSLGRKHGFACETQGTLFFDIVRIIRRHRPAAFLLENVRNLVSHDGGRTMAVIMSTLNELRYQVQAGIVDARSWVPQHRKRTFIVGFRDAPPFNFDLLRVPDGKLPTLDAVLHPEDGREAPEEPYTEGPLARVADRYTLSTHLWNYLQTYARKHRDAGNGFGCSVFTRNDVARTLSARYHKDGSEILISRGGRKNPRRLTPRECSRLMGFDAIGDQPFKIPVSDTQAYKQFGNAVVVPVVTAIAHEMIEQMQRSARRAA